MKRSTRKSVPPAARWAACLLGACALVGCAGGSRVLGRAPAGPPLTVAAVRELPAASEAVINGAMVEKCPVAGCWFDLQDATGSIRIDTKAAGFVVVDVPLRAAVTVEGTLIGKGADRQLAATGIRY